MSENNMAAETIAFADPVPSQPETSTATEEASKAEPTTSSETPAAATESKPEDTKDEIAPVAAVGGAAAAVTGEKKDEAKPAEEKVIEPITEGQLTYKGPGLLKSLIPSKKEFWLSDEAVTPQSMNSYLRGEKPEIANPVVAWASQTGKGLLFFNKKGDTSRKHPGGVLALYEATDLRKVIPNEISFKLHGSEHTLKAATDAERDGWYLSLEKAVAESASKEHVRDSEGYKAEIAKLNKPSIAAGAARDSKRSQSTPRKTVEADGAGAVQRNHSDAEDEADKKKKARSTSRGVLDRLKGKKDEAETKKDEKKATKEEKKEQKEEPKAAKEETEKDHKPEEAAAAAVGVGAGAAAIAAEHNAEEKKDVADTDDKAAEKVDEKPKASKRGSIFGKIGGMLSPAKEKDQKDAELRPEVPPKDEPVSEDPPVLPETTTQSEDPVKEAAGIEADAEKNAEAALPKPADKKEEPLKKEEPVTTPSKEKGGFLSTFMNKRNRSVSPSQHMKEPAAKTEAEPAKEEAKEEATEPAKAEEPAPETALPVAAAAESEKPTEAAKPAEAAKEDKTETSTPNKRQSVLGSLGRRASKAFKGLQAPKKENVAPKTDAEKAEDAEAKPAEEEAAATTGESKPAEDSTTEPVTQIGDVVPEAVHVQSAPAVTASA